MFDLTENELRASLVLVASCLDGMGGKRPSDLQYDEYTWIDGKDLIRAGWTRHSAAGTFSSLLEKGMIGEYEPGQMILETKGWRYLDTIWDQNETLRKELGIK